MSESTSIELKEEINPVYQSKNDEDIVQTIQDGDAAAVDKWIAHMRPNVDVQLSGKKTALHLAAEFAKPRIMSILLDAGADTGLLLKTNKRTALHTVCLYNKKFISEAKSDDVIQCVKLLLIKMSVEKINAQDKKGRTALHYAVRRNDPVTVSRLLLEKGANPVLQTSNNGRTPAHRAALLGNAGLLQEMMEVNGKCVLTRDVKDETALHYAAEGGVFETAKVILDAIPQNVDEPDFQFALTELNKDRGNLLNYAARGGSAKLAKLLIDRGVPLDPKGHKPSPLADAVKTGYIEVAQVILEGKDGTLPKVSSKLFMMIVKAGYENLAKAVLERPDWHAIIRGRKSHERDRSILSLKNEYSTPFRVMIRRLPEVAKLVLDKCVVEGAYKDNPNNEFYEVAYNYEFIDDFKDDDDPDLDLDNSKDDDESDSEDNSKYMSEYGFQYVVDPKRKQLGPREFSKQNHPLSIMVRHERKELLYHPVTLALIDYKWKTYGRLSYHLNMLFYGVFLIFLTSFALVVQNPQARNQNDSVCPDFNVTTCPETDVHRRNFASVAAAVVILFGVCRLFLEIIQLLVKRFRYFSDWVNWMEMVLLPCSIIFAAMPNWICPCVSNWQWQLGVVAVFLAWCDLIVFTSKFQFVGIYVLMFIEIIKTFLKLILLLLLLIITFGITFYMIFDDDAVKRSPFSLEIRSMIRTLMMTTGEMDYDGIFRLGLDGGSESAMELPYLPVAYIVWILFVILMPVLFANMLTGLAVGDTKNVLDDAEFRLLATTIDLVLSVEEFRFLPCCRNWIRKRTRRKNIKKGRFTPNQPRVTPWDKIIDWLKQFFGVEQHKFDTLEVVNQIKRPEKDIPNKILDQTIEVAASLEKVQGQTQSEIADLAANVKEIQKAQKFLVQEISEIKAVLQQLRVEIVKKSGTETGELV